MNTNLFSHRRTEEAYLDSLKRGSSLEKIKRQKALSSELLSWFAPKGYPCIFLDQRLSSRLNKHAIEEMK